MKHTSERIQDAAPGHGPLHSVANPRRTRVDAQGRPLAVSAAAVPPQD